MHATLDLTATLVADRQARFTRSAERRRFLAPSRRQNPILPTAAPRTAIPSFEGARHPLPAGRTPAGGEATPARRAA
jgi:hypothetical protein